MTDVSPSSPQPSRPRVDLGGASAARDAAPGAEPVEQEMAALMSHAGRGFLQRTLKTTPQRGRALETLAALLDAGRQVGLQRGKAGLTLQAVADAAGVRLAGVYRYFASPEALIDMLVRRAQVSRFAALRAEFADLRHASLEETADTIAAGIQGLDLIDRGVPRSLAVMVVRDHHRIAYAELWDLSGHMIAVMRRDGLEVGGAARARLAIALAAAGAALKMAVLEAPHEPGTDHFRATLARLFLDALRP